MACSTETMNVTPAAWIAMVSAISDKPQVQLSNGSILKLMHRQTLARPNISSGIRPRSFSQSVSELRAWRPTLDTRPYGNELAAAGRAFLDHLRLALSQVDAPAKRRCGRLTPRTNSLIYRPARRFEKGST